MLLNDTILKQFRISATQETIKEIHLGLGYTALTLENGNCGLCYTPKGKSGSCTVFKDPVECKRTINRYYKATPPSLD